MIRFTKLKYRNIVEGTGTENDEKLAPLGLRIVSIVNWRTTINYAVLFSKSSSA